MNAFHRVGTVEGPRRLIEENIKREEERVPWHRDLAPLLGCHLVGEPCAWFAADQLSPYMQRALRQIELSAALHTVKG